MSVRCHRTSARRTPAARDARELRRALRLHHARHEAVLPEGHGQDAHDGHLGAAGDRLERYDRWTDDVQVSTVRSLETQTDNADSTTFTLSSSHATFRTTAGDVYEKLWGPATQGCCSGNTVCRFRVDRGPGHFPPRAEGAGIYPDGAILWHRAADPKRPSHIMPKDRKPVRREAATLRRAVRQRR